MSKYDNYLAEACFVAGNVAGFVRELINPKAPKHGVVIGAWNVLEADYLVAKSEVVLPEGIDSKEKAKIIRALPEAKAFAMCRTNLSREAEKIFGHGLVVENDKLVPAKKRNTTKKEVSAFMELAKLIDKDESDAVKAELIVKINSILAGK